MSDLASPARPIAQAAIGSLCTACVVRLNDKFEPVENGGVGGLWRRTLGRASIGVEAFLYERPKPGDARALETAAADLGRFFGRRVTVETALL